MVPTTPQDTGAELLPGQAFPLRISAHSDPRVSRWLWLVKWLLLLPHFVLLAFLWVAFFVTTVMAFFAILVTGTYPRTLLDFNVGVLRWTWRVMFYGYGSLATDRYPPFSLHDVPDYPAHLDVDPPAQLSRGLVLVKWWLLAIPHYLVLAVVLGGGWSAATDNRQHMGLLPLLVLVAGVALLFTGRYPGRLFALVMGLNRWVFRVWCYAALMTDRYPPFALDQGGDEPHTVHAVALEGTESGPTAPPPAPASPHPGWTGGRVVTFVAGTVLLSTGLGLVATAGTLGAVDQFGRDDAGLVTAPERRLESPGVAVTSPRLYLEAAGAERFLPGRIVGTVRVTARPVGDQRLFVGVGPTDEVQAFLDDVDHDAFVRARGGHMYFRHRAGERDVPPPGTQDFWAVSSTGDDETRLTWEPEPGDWTYVLMNADASRGVRADMAVGVELPALDDVALALALVALLLLASGAVLVAVPLRAASRTERV